MEIDYTQLLIDVQKKSNITITTIRDVKYLKEEIETKTNSNISFNTLRRLFGFLEKTYPSALTLNILSNYLGFPSFSNYKNNKTNFNDWYFQQYLLHIRRLKKINSKEIEQINVGLLDENNIVYLAYFITFQFEKNNLSVLDKLFKEVNFKNISGTQLHKFASILSLSLSLIPEKKSLKIYSKLIVYDNFRNNIPLINIDYTQLNSRYFKVLQLIEKNNANSSDLIFVSLMYIYKAFYIEDADLSINELKKPLEFENFYSALKGRYYGCHILAAQKIDQSFKKEIFIQCTKNKISFFLEEIIPALIIKNEYHFLEELIDCYYEDIFEADVWSAITTNSIYLIGLANVNWFKGNVSMAKRNLELIDLEKVELGYFEYVQIFYYLTILKISFSEKNRLLNKNAKHKIMLLVKITNFKKFKIESEKYILN